MRPYPNRDEIRADLARHDLFGQITYLEALITQLDATLEGEITDERLQLLEWLLEQHADLQRRVASLRHPGVRLLIEFPPDYRGPVGQEWEYLESGHIRTWVTREELEAILWVNEAMYETIIERIAA